MLRQNQEKQSPVWEFAVFAMIVVIAITLRITNLEILDFGQDEILHIFTAEEIIKGNPPALPSGYSYERALLYTYTLVGIGSMAGLDEWTARLSSVLFGTITVLVVFLVCRTWYSGLVGLVVAFLVAVSPMEIEFSREVRMYSMFQFFYLLLIFFLYQGYEARGKIPTGEKAVTYFARWWSMLPINPLMLGVAGLLFIISNSIHPLALAGVAGPLAYFLLTGVVDLVSSNTPKIVKWKHVLFIMMGILGLLVTWIVFPDLIDNKLKAIRWAPTWANGNVDNWQFYRQHLLADYPIILGTLPVATVFALSKYPKLSLYLACCLAVPLVLHSAVFAWKAYRYIFYLMPIIFILWSVGFCAAMASLYKSLVKCHNRVLSRKNFGKYTAIGLLFVGIAFMLSTMPWFILTAKSYVLHRQNIDTTMTRHPDWKKAMSYISRSSLPGEIIIASFPALAKYYGPELPIYQLNHNMMALLLNEDLRNAEGQLLEYTVGAPVIIDLEMLRKVIQEFSSGWFVIERTRFNGDRPIPPDIRDYVVKQFQLRYSTDSNEWKEMMVWHWDKS